MTDKLWTYPRILVDEDLEKGATIPLSKHHAHYFNTVLRKQSNDKIRLFNTRDGEWLGTLQNLSKKHGGVTLEVQTRTQDEPDERTSLFFAPIKKSRMDILIEKAVELGVTDLHPVITSRTQNAKLKYERLQAQITEAAEQCERLTIPRLHDIIKLDTLPTDQTIYACIERDDEDRKPVFIANITNKAPCFLIGPEGGFSDEEIKKLHQQTHIQPVSLGPRIYRAETASIICLAHAAFLNQK